MMLGTIVKCPKCNWSGYKKLGKYNTVGFDPLMETVKCLNCGLEYKVSPPPWYKEGDYPNGE